VGAAREGSVTHARQVHVVDKERLSGQEARVFVALDPFAKVVSSGHVVILCEIRSLTAV
jgi:hypothetical protein